MRPAIFGESSKKRLIGHQQSVSFSNLRLFDLIDGDNLMTLFIDKACCLHSVNLFTSLCWVLGFKHLIELLQGSILRFHEEEVDDAAQVSL